MKPIHNSRASMSRLGLTLVCGWVLTCSPAVAASKSNKRDASTDSAAPAAASAPTSFAPLPQEHPLASFWNDPEFNKRLLGSYGFASELEPRLAPDEQAAYRDKIVPLLRADQVKARSELESLIKPTSSALFDFTLGNLCFQAEDLTNAVKHFQAATDKFPDFRRAQKNLGFVLARDGKYPEALKPLIRTVSLGGGDGKVFGLLGFIYLNQGRNVSAEAAYREALVFEPENADFKLGLVRSAIATANYDYALALLDEMIKQYPERDNLWSLQANLYIQKEQPTKALVSLEILRRLGKASPQTLYLLGDLHMSQDSRDLALNAYLDAMQQDGGKNPSKALRAAQILVGRSAWTEAHALFTKIRSTPNPLSPTDELKLLKLESKASMASGAAEKAIATLEQILGRDPLDGEALLLAGDYYSKNAKKEKAELRYRTAGSIQGFEAEAFVKQAQLLVQSQKYAAAVELLKKAQKIKPRENVQRYLDKVEQLARLGSRS